MLPGVSSDLLLRFGHVSEWWWRMTGFHPNHPHLLPLLNRRQLHRQAAPEQPQIADGNTTPALNQGVSMEQIGAVISDQLSQLKIELRNQIQESVAAGVAEVLQRQKPLPALHYIPEQSAQPTNPAPLPSAPNHTTSLPSEISTDLEIMPFSLGASGHENHLGNTDDDDDDMYVDPPIQAARQKTTTNACQLLQQLYPNQPNVNFKSLQQRQIVEEALACERNFIGVLPTGGGKSLTFLLPVLQEEDSKTLVVIPNRALLNDMLHRCQELNLAACQWKATMTIIYQNRLILLAVESVVSPAFRMYVFWHQFIDYKFIDDFDGLFLGGFDQWKVV